MKVSTNNVITDAQTVRSYIQSVGNYGVSVLRQRTVLRAEALPPSGLLFTDATNLRGCNLDTIAPCQSASWMCVFGTSQKLINFAA